MMVTLLEIAQQSPKYLGYFSETICYQEFVKIAQSDHTVQDVVKTEAAG